MSKESQLRERAAAVIPGGMYGHQSASFLPPSYPQYFSRAKGSRLWDADGREYIDYIGGYGTNLLGYAHPDIDAAAVQQLSSGDTMTGPAPVIVDLAEKLVGMVTHADWAVFCKNGTDATSMAVVCARAYKNRRKILMATGAYHGAAIWCTPVDVGITREDRAHNVYFEYNNAESLEQVLRSHAGDVAAVLASPIRHDVHTDHLVPTEAYAKAVRRLCDEHDALLVVDEVRTGFRLARGSSWDALGVNPDLSAWGKAMGNGYPISALLGNNKTRQAFQRIFVTGSYWCSAVPLAASLRTLELIESTDYLERSLAIGQMLRDGIEEQVRRHGLELRQTGPVQMPQMLFAGDVEEKLGNIWTNAAIELGVYLHPFHNMFVCAALTDEDISRTLEVTDRAFVAFKQHRKLTPLSSTELR
ncbi:glutamate-1-semialdehyde 2,1-aminomutase [Bradyrhizobium sp. LTSP885]|uniref:aminotransferase class III-fold pyridoxal phosphate-dependent enzyme n=1 Tax=Bradyrhizobium sp. LTSP885 TaxID=1619232 RepID=UPI0005C98D00|nr:aminotransferase class III-fold pyridoxal phosphate-dependent enzyme [Bradyrhizobium sp. LTSP885]KJC48771.1 glutamate-1-semialdehyde 2,1-aminomutase [Bradyrhizobium sp. LTSP885]